jgi:hypothetical protein
LARAGFFYKPSPDSLDNVQCFSCGIKLDGWEIDDVPIKEHLSHSAGCDWARSFYAGAGAKQQIDETGDDNGLPDPMSDELVAARTKTFEYASTWPHEGKRGWKCKISKMVEAGWCWDPAQTPNADGEDAEEVSDGVTCFYCDLALDGWEPKDDPMVEHRKRTPDCAFFALVEKFGSKPGKKTAKGRGKKGAVRASTASKASSRMSAQSALSTFSQEPSFADVGAELGVESDAPAVDDSIVTTGSQATITGTMKGKKKGGRAKAPAKGAKGRKRANTVESEAEAEPLYPDLSSNSQTQSTQTRIISSSQASLAEEPVVPKKGKKGRSSKQTQLDSSVIEISSLDNSSQPKKPARGRKAKAQAEPKNKPEEVDMSDVSAQLQDELERSVDFDVQHEMEDVTPQPEDQARPARGVKRTSDGLVKRQRNDSDMSSVVMEFPVPPKPAEPQKAKKGRHPSKQVTAELQSQDEVSSQGVEVPDATNAKKTAASKAKGKAKKPSSARSSRSSKATITGESQQTKTGFEVEEDLERDEREIEAELERIAKEQTALQVEQDNVAEYEPSPSQQQSMQQDSQSIRSSAKPKTSTAPQLPPLDLSSKAATPSPGGSDKENRHSSIAAMSAKKLYQGAPTLSPTKTTRIPLAPGTPNRPALSPSKHLSPSKTLSKLTSTVPWEPIDIESILLASPQPTPGTVAERLAGVAGGLTSPEKGLTVEGWIRWRAERAEEELKRKCEEMVGVFEREGVKGLGCLEGIVIAGS